MHFYAFFNCFYCALFSLYCSWANRSEFGFCQFAHCSSLFFLLSTIAPKINVRSRAIERCAQLWVYEPAKWKKRELHSILRAHLYIQCIHLWHPPFQLYKDYKDNINKVDAYEDHTNTNTNTTKTYFTKFWFMQISCFLRNFEQTFETFKITIFEMGTPNATSLTLLNSYFCTYLGTKSRLYLWNNLGNDWTKRHCSLVTSIVVLTNTKTIIFYKVVPVISWFLNNSFNYGTVPSRISSTLSFWFHSFEK